MMEASPFIEIYTVVVILILGMKSIFDAGKKYDGTGFICSLLHFLTIPAVALLFLVRVREINQWVYTMLVCGMTLILSMEVIWKRVVFEWEKASKKRVVLVTVAEVAAWIVFWMFFILKHQWILL